MADPPLAELPTLATDGAGRGAAAVIVNSGPDASAPPGFETVIRARPSAARRLEGRLTIRVSPFARTVATACPFQYAVAPVRKPEPVIRAVSAGDPAGAVAGSIAVTTSGTMANDNAVD